MPSTDSSSAAAAAGRYHFQFAWNSPYGHAVRLLETMRADGALVIDLGCGYGPIAEPLSERGFQYVGCDLDPTVAPDLRARGFEYHDLDLTAHAALPDRLAAIADGRGVHALLLLDVIEHLAATQPFLEALRAASLRLNRPLLVVSVPNVAHFDLGAKLALGRWDISTSGLLDETHVQLFTETRMTAELRRLGWVQYAQDDFRLRHSDQSESSSHPALLDGTPLREFLWSVRTQVNETASVNQFVRAFAFTPASMAPAPEPPARPFLTVIMRTQGGRALNLLDALTCLAAQTDDSFEVRLLVHAKNDATVGTVQQLVDRFAPEFSGRVFVRGVATGGRARPLNVGLGDALGHYVAFLDDDDLVTADWIETFHATVRAAPGRVARSIVADRTVRRVTATELTAPYVVEGGLALNHGDSFDFVEHLFTNRTPFCSFAVPMDVVRELRLSFQEDLPVVEDWDFLLRAAMLAGVRDSWRVTSIYHRWTGVESSLGTIPASVWTAARRMVLHRLDAAPLLLPPGSASRLADHQEWDLQQLEGHRAAVSALHEELRMAGCRFAELEQYAEGLRAEVGRANWEAERIRQSEFWRMTAPFRRALDWVRGIGQRNRQPPEVS